VKKRFFLAGVALAALAATASVQAQGTLRIGFFPGPYADQFKRGVQPALEARGIKVQVTEFTNIVQPNTALMDGSLDANVFQNRAFMDSFNNQQKGQLVEVLQVPSAPLGLYSAKHKDLKALPNGATVAVPNEATSLARALTFLQLQGLITLDPNVPAGRHSERNLKMVPLDAPQMPRTMPEFDLAAILGNHVLAAGMLLSSALALEDPAPQFRIILVARKDVAEGPLVKQLVEGYKSDTYRRFVETDPKAKGFSRPEYWR
jgi:D-methionine transport system substrate-binding protein